MFKTIKKIFSKSYDCIVDNILAVYYFFKFLGIIYRITYYDLSKLNYNQLNKLKSKIVNNGMVSLKFMQWYVSRLENEDSIKYGNIVYEFESIFDRCPYHCLEETKNIFLKDYGLPLEDYIDINSLSNIGSGSIGQVYKGTMSDGTEVAFKVKHPEIDRQKKGQFWVINSIIFFQKFSFFRNKFNLHFDTQDFMDNLLLQLDFGNEAKNCLKFNKNFKDNDYVIIPKVYFYSDNTIIQSYEEGIELNELSSGNKQKAVLNMYCFLNQMIMIDNWIHGDFHKKNWKVRKNENSSFYSLVVYDFGLCFSTPNIKDNRNLWKSFEDNKIEDVCNFINMLVVGELNEEDNKEIKEHLDNLFERPFNIKDMLEKLLKILGRRNLVVNKFSLNIILLATLIEKLLIEANMIEKGINYKDEVNRTDKVQSRKADIITFCKTTNSYQELHKYIKADYDSMKTFSLFNINNSKLEFDPIEF